MSRSFQSSSRRHSGLVRRSRSFGIACFKSSVLSAMPGESSTTSSRSTCVGRPVRSSSKKKSETRPSAPPRHAAFSRSSVVDPPQATPATVRPALSASEIAADARPPRLVARQAKPSSPGVAVTCSSTARPKRCGLGRNEELWRNWRREVVDGQLFAPGNPACRDDLDAARLDHQIRCGRMVDVADARTKRTHDQHQESVNAFHSRSMTSRKLVETTFCPSSTQTSSPALRDRVENKPVPWIELGARRRRQRSRRSRPLAASPRIVS